MYNGNVSVNKSFNMEKSVSTYFGNIMFKEYIAVYDYDDEFLGYLEGGLYDFSDDELLSEGRARFEF